MEVREPSGRYLAEAQGATAWSTVKLGDAATFRTGPFGSALHKSDYVVAGVPVINPMQIDDGRLRPTETMSITESAAQRLADFRLRAGDIVIGRRGEMGRCAYVAQEHDGWLCGTGSMIVRCGPRLDARFVQRALSSSETVAAIESASVGTTMINLNQATLGNLSLRVPESVDEQRAIAFALSDADTLIDSLEQLLSKQRQIKQGAMQELLTGQRRLPGFTAPWQPGCLGAAITDLVAGVSVNSDLELGGFGVPSVVKTSALSSGVFDPAECKAIVPADLVRATTSPRRDTLLISRMNTPDLVGEVGYVDQDYDWLYLPDRIWMTRTASSDAVSVRWLGHLLSSPSFKRRIGDTATGTSGSMKNISKGALLSLAVAYPSVPEQHAIAQVLTDMDASLAALQARLAKARELKQALMQVLLTGRIRLLPP